MAPRGSVRARLLSLRVVAVFILFALLWLPVSNALVDSLTDSDPQARKYRAVKDFIFLVLTSALLYGLVVQALRAERALHKDIAAGRGHIDLVLNQIPAHLWTTDRDLVITSFRGRSREEMGYRAGEPVDMTLAEALSIEDPTFPTIAAHHAALDGKVISYGLEWKGRSYRSVVSPLRNLQGNIEGCVGLSLDVTAERSKDRHLLTMIDQLRASRDQRDLLVRHLVQVEQQERERISAGIHDDSIQVMTSAAMALDLLVERVQDQHANEILRRTRKAVGDSMRRLRRLAFELRPVDLDEHGLGPSLRLLLERASNEGAFRFELVDEGPNDVPSATRYLLYRVATEAITNARKHAKASLVIVRLRPNDEGIQLRIEDDGVGIATDRRPDDHHFGLKDMERRADAVGGRFRVSDRPGGGTVVEFWAPLRTERLGSEVAG